MSLLGNETYRGQLVAKVKHTAEWFSSQKSAQEHGRFLRRRLLKGVLAEEQSLIANSWSACTK